MPRPGAFDDVQWNVQFLGDDGLGRRGSLIIQAFVSFKTPTSDFTVEGFFAANEPLTAMML